MRSAIATALVAIIATGCAQLPERIDFRLNPAIFGAKTTAADAQAPAPVFGPETIAQRGKALDLAEAKRLADDLTTHNIAAGVSTYESRTRDAGGMWQKVTALRSLDVPLPVAAVQAREIQLTGTLNKIGIFAATRSEAMIVSIAAVKKDQAWLKDAISAGTAYVPAVEKAVVKIETTTIKAGTAKVTLRPVETI